MLDQYERMKIIFVCFCLITLTQNVYCAMTEAQMKSAGKLMRNVCQPKTKITSAQIEEMHNGSFPPEKEYMSYTECILRTGQIMKDGKVNIAMTRAQMQNMPPSLLEGALAALEKCSDAGQGGDKFVAAFEFYKCFYEYDPANFFLP